MSFPWRNFYPAIIGAFGVIVLAHPIPPSPVAFKNRIEKEDFRETLRAVGIRNEFPTDIRVELDGKPRSAILQYGLDASLQARMEELLAQHRPDYGAFVALEPETGRILAMVSAAQGKKLGENFATRATFPSASIFKVVTAAAAIEHQAYTPDTRIQFNGRAHTLYKRQIFDQRPNRWTNSMSLADAFGKSVNPVFGKLGAWVLGPQVLRDFAERFGFNREIPSDIPVQAGHAPIPDDHWGLAEAASGFTRENTMSPLQGAWIAAAVANEGVLMEPYLVQSAFSETGERLYEVSPRRASHGLDPNTTDELRALFQETVTSGTSRGVFRTFVRRSGNPIEVGGKTGSLTGTNPRGKYDWFVGYAKSPSGKRIAFASLAIHGELWRVKAAVLARQAIEHYFADELPARGRSRRLATRADRTL